MKSPEKIALPAATPFPIVLAFGLTLVFAGMVTAASVSILGAIVAGVGAVGWFREVLPAEAHEWVLVEEDPVPIQTERTTVERMAVSFQRASLPVETYPISAGVKGGLAGGVVMAILAAAYGLLSGHGIWYPMNLLVAGLFPGISAEQISAFNLEELIAAVPIHLLISLLVGLLYGAMLPMAPRRPILLGGFAAPLLWSFLLYGSLSVINPVMNQRIHWLWFVFSQIGFGITAGLIVVRQERIRTRQPLPLALRMGIEAAGLVEDHPEDRDR